MTARDTHSKFDPDDLQFGDAFVSSAILLFRKTPPAP